ncbi:hypothetical protein HPB50_017471 [Hyalomma asiaticum]|uniref:Uncharacterized protein n=1 Tax=Hyalomma asiaticum TaxID=266040 RepID=A0ACB7RLD9_HYAAI|nr:hypothetical protein HPB50_017471 [Hyalomma asiaticum]
MKKSSCYTSTGPLLFPTADANGDGLCEQPRLRAASCQANITAWEVSDDLRHKLNLCSASSSAENSVLPPVVTPAMLEMGLGNAERRSSPTTASFGDPLSGREPFKAPAASDLPLLTPMAFTKPLGQPAAMPSLPFGPASFATPGMFMNGDVVAKNRESVNALTKDQLKDALVHMLQRCASHGSRAPRRVRSSAGRLPAWLPHLPEEPLQAVFGGAPKDKC